MRMRNNPVGTYTTLHRPVLAAAGRTGMVAVAREGGGAELV